MSKQCKKKAPKGHRAPNTEKSCNATKAAKNQEEERIRKQFLMEDEMFQRFKMPIPFNALLMFA